MIKINLICIQEHPYLLILLSLNLIFSLHYPLLGLQQFYPKILAFKFASYMFFISLSNNREYFSNKKFNRYLNIYPYYSLILLGLQQLNLLFM